jgi:riboflavin-specific deaminase-like protein
MNKVASSNPPKHKPAAKGHRASGARPFVFLNVAIGADGKIATANRVVSSFGSARDKKHLLELRARADAVMAGANTVNSGRITLGPGPRRYRRLRVRLGLAEYNLRIVVSRSGTVDPEAEVFRHRFSPVVVLTTRSANTERLEQLRRAGAIVRICGLRTINFREALCWLRKEWRVRRLLCEGGGELNDALFRAGLVDEVHLTVCPKIIGGRRAPTLADGTGVAHLTASTRLRLSSARPNKEEMFLLYRVVAPKR